MTDLVGHANHGWAMDKEGSLVCACKAPDKTNFLTWNTNHGFEPWRPMLFTIVSQKTEVSASGDDVKDNAGGVQGQVAAPGGKTKKG